MKLETIWKYIGPIVTTVSSGFIMLLIVHFKGSMEEDNRKLQASFEKVSELSEKINDHEKRISRLEN